MAKCDCPAHVLVFKQGITSYRDLPIRMAEFVGELAFKNRLYAVAYVAGLFYILPVILELIF